jgi:hypothetical protein
MPSKDHLMLRSARRARLEARTALLQCSSCRVDQFPDSLESGNPGAAKTGRLPWTSLSRG